MTHTTKSGGDVVQITPSFFHCSDTDFHLDFEHINYINTSKSSFLHLYNRGSDNNNK